MNIGKFSVKRPVTIAMTVLIVLMFGVVSFTKMSIDLLPKIELPMLLVMTNYDGAGPEEVETKVTKPLESALASVSGIETIASSSAAGSSIVMLTFEFGTDLAEATNYVRDSVEMAKMMMPSDIGDVTIMKLNMDSMPILMIGISGERSLSDIRSIADEKIAPRLERINGVAAATVMGGTEQQISITVDPYKLSAYGLTAGQIAQAVQVENSNYAGGYITQGDRQVLVRTLGQYNSVEELRDTVITLPSGGTVRLGDITEVEMTTSDTDAYITLNGEDIIAIGIQKESDGNAVDVDKAVRAALAELDEELYDDIEIVVAYSSADMILESVATVEENLFLAVIISMLIIYLFLGNFRSTIIIGVAIPIALISTFVMLYFGKQTLNMVTLAALALCVGMVVDNSTVVLENIYRHRQMGKNKYHAAIDGTQEIASAVVASTLTTVAVYLPFIFVTGLVAQIFVPFVLTFCFALTASLVVSLTVVPMMSSKLLVMKDFTDEKNAKGLDKFFVRFEKAYSRFVDIYEDILATSLNNKKKTLLLVTAALIGSCLLIPFIGAELLPYQDAGEINISINLPANTVLEETEKIALQVEEMVNEVPEVILVMNSVGGTGGMGGGSTNTASLIVMLQPVEERDRSSKVIARELQEKADCIPGAEITVTATDMMSMGNSAISIQIKGNDDEALETLAESIEKAMAEVEGAVEISNSLASTDEELNIVIDREKAAYYKVSTSSVYSTVALALQNSTISKYRANGAEIDIVMKYPEHLTKSLDNLNDLMIPSSTGGQVPLCEVAEVVHGFGQKSISRQDQSRIASVSCEVYGRDMGSVYQDIQEKIKTIPIPSGCAIETGGSADTMNSAFKDIITMILMALFLVYMVMACQFENLMEPILIMISIPVMFIGVFIGLFLCNQTINMMSLLGILMLEGIVVNNAIVLVDYVNQLRAKGLCKREALIEAGRTRMRPILMTTLTTALAMIPQLISTSGGSDIFKPMSATVIFGLLCSTVISLIVIPIIYETVESWPAKIRRKVMKNNPQEEIDLAMQALEEGCWHDWEELQKKLEEDKRAKGLID